MMRKVFRWSVVGLVAAGAFACALPGESAELASYRAAYEVKTATLKPGGSFVAVSGTMAYTTEKACDGWVTAQEMALLLTASDGTVVEQGFRYSSWESFDGTRYRFASASHVDDEAEQFQGRAVISPDGTGEAIYTVPESKTFPLPAGTLFPMRQTAWIIGNGEAGKSGHLPHPTFDGTDGEGANQAIVFLGRRIEPSPKESDPLLKRPGWLVRLSYYPPGDKSGAPDYEVEALQLDNGLAPRLLLEYQDFATRMSLVKLEPLPAPKC